MPADRHSALLQPIRDLALNWDIDVASELEEYLNEIENLQYVVEGSDGNTVNFAEAAMLIQGSTCIYSKKVEFLYQLVYETLDLLASKKKLLQGSSVGDDGLDKDTEHMIDEEELFLPLDDLAEDKNIDLDENEPQALAATITRMPAALLTLSEAEKQNDSTLMTRQGVVFGNRSDFKMNTSIVHESGTLLLGIDDVKLLDHSYQVPAGAVGFGANASIAAPDPPDNSMMDHDGFDDDGDDGEMMFQDEPDDAGPGGPAEEEHTMAANAARGSAAGTAPKATGTGDDIWDLLDPHAGAGAGAGADKPARRIKSYRVPTAVAVLQAKGRKGKKAAAVYQAPLMSISDFCAGTALLQAKRVPSRAGALQNMLFPEFAHLYYAEKKRRAKVGKADRAQFGASAVAADSSDPANLSAMSAVAMAPEAAFDDYDDDDGGGFGGSDGEDDGFMDVPVPEPDFSSIGNEGLELPDYGAAAVEGSTALTYEDLVRQHIESYVAEAQRYVIETDLSRRVQEWESKIKPLLDSELQRTPYDIHAYGRTMLGRLPDRGKKKVADSKQPAFEELVGTKQPYEVCRMFLATLQLANQGNVEIIQSSAAEATNMRLKLVTRSAVYDMENIHPA